MLELPSGNEVKTCENCIFLRKLLEKSEEERRYYIDLLLSREGKIKNEEIFQEEFKKLDSINRFVTLSAIRKEAERKSLEKKEQLASNNELTEAELKFQEELNKVS